MLTLDYARYTPTEQKLLVMLADGLPHTVEELATCLPDELASLTTVKAHIWKIRQKLHGSAIAGERLNGRFVYRMVDRVRSDG